MSIYSRRVDAAFSKSDDCADGETEVEKMWSMWESEHRNSVNH